MPLNEKHDLDEAAERFERSAFAPAYYDDGPGRAGHFDHAGDGAPPRPQIRATPFTWRDPKTLPPRRWLYGRHYIRKYATATIAPGGLGKTSLALVEALAMVTGRPLLGSEPRQRLRVWYWNGEDPLEEVERRVMAACLHYGIEPHEIEGRLFLDSGRQVPIIIARRMKDQTVIQEPMVEEISGEIRSRSIDVLILDPFVSCHDVPENDNGAIDKVTKTWGRIAGDTDCGVDLVHHVRKASGGQSSYSVEDARGGSALIGAVRSARVLNVMSPEEASNAGVPGEQRRRYFRVDDGKSNMQPPQDRAVWRHLETVGLGNGDDQDPEDLIGVVTEWAMPGLFDAIPADALRKVQAEVRRGTWAENVQAGNWIGRLVGQTLGLDHTDDAEKAKIKRILKTWIKNGALKVEHQHDGNKGREKPVIVVGEPA
ncbi:helicase RepA family protein [Methylobacterium variabile]|jgi:AAA domain|uniref:helicase RepA family protein n=1 Tax=Methylobacterium variabile TaxID=298794 RepID=UPI00069F4D23|nr:helicase RepA family protein [Methylobacterium variabile]